MKYDVRIEFDVVTTDFANVEVEANSRDEAINKAIEKFQEHPENYDVYGGNYLDSTISPDTENWDVEEL